LFSSHPRARRPRPSAATSALPVPANGSSTRHGTGAAGGHGQVGFQVSSCEPFALAPLAITTRAQGAPQRGQAPFALVPARMHGSTRSGGKVGLGVARRRKRDSKTCYKSRLPPARPDLVRDVVAPGIAPQGDLSRLRLCVLFLRVLSRAPGLCTRSRNKEQAVARKCWLSVPVLRDNRTAVLNN
jgi:hypothetical protein